MNPAELKERTKVLGQAATKVALVLPQNVLLGLAIRNELLSVSFELPAKARGLLINQSTLHFAQKITTCNELLDKLSYLLEFILDEKLMDAQLIEPLIEECEKISYIFQQVFKTIKDKLDNA